MTCIFLHLQCLEQSKKSWCSQLWSFYKPKTFSFSLTLKVAFQNCLLCTRGRMNYITSFTFLHSNQISITSSMLWDKRTKFLKSSHFTLQSHPKYNYKFLSQTPGWSFFCCCFFLIYCESINSDHLWRYISSPLVPSSQRTSRSDDASLVDKGIHWFDLLRRLNLLCNILQV